MIFIVLTLVVGIMAGYILGIAVAHARWLDQETRNWRRLAERENRRRPI